MPMIGLVLFGGGLYGLYARIHGVATHYLTIHAWLPVPRIPCETEYHLASIFFNMDSAIECLTFALNALGCAAMAHEFRDISNENALRQISPKDILGRPSATISGSLISGYQSVFPTLQSLWQANRKLLSIVVEQHDVSKHRENILSGSKHRLDPPSGFYEQLGIGKDSATRTMYWPIKEMFLRKDPKSARVGRKPQKATDSVMLETVASDYCIFMNKSGTCALQDAATHIKLAHSQFIES